MNVAKYQAMHGVVGNAPSNAVMDATAQSGVPRMFYGSGSPNSVLLAGNGRYNASQGGWVYNVLLVAAGTGYAVGDTITLTGGTKTTPVIVTIDSVASGVIQECHVSQAGVFTVYPTAVATQGSTSGGGTGATFWLNTPPPDLYVDLTTITAPVLWVCTVAGSSSGSTWQKVSGGGSGGIQQFKIVSDGGDYWICNTFDGTTTGTVNQNVIKPYKLRAGSNAITTETVYGGQVNVYTYAPVYITGGSGPVWYYVRTVKVSGTVVETDYVAPPALANDIIYASSCTTSIISGIPLTILTATVNAGGTGYVSGDIGKVLTVAGGTGTSATLTISTVSGGSITGVTISNSGQYTVNPTLIANVATGSTTGSGATFNLTMAPALEDINTDGRAWAQ